MPRAPTIATGGVVPTDDKRMAIDPVPDLAPGTYTVQSTTTSAADGDIDRTTWTFTVVAAPTSEPTATPAPSATPAPTANTGPSARPIDVRAAVGERVAECHGDRDAASTSAPSADGGQQHVHPAATSCCRSSLRVVILVVIGGYLYSRRDRSTPTQP